MANTITLDPFVTIYPTPKLDPRLGDALVRAIQSRAGLGSWPGMSAGRVYDQPHMIMISFTSAATSHNHAYCVDEQTGIARREPCWCQSDDSGNTYAAHNQPNEIDLRDVIAAQQV